MVSVRPYHMTNEPPGSGPLFRVVVTSPNGEHVRLGILANCEVAHIRHGGLWHADSSAEFLDPGGVLVDGVYTDVIGSFMVRMLSRQHAAVRGCFCAASIDVLVILHAAEGIDLPAEQTAVKLLCAFEIVCRDFKPDDTRRNVFLYCAHI